MKLDIGLRHSCFFGKASFIKPIMCFMKIGEASFTVDSNGNFVTSLSVSVKHLVNASELADD